METKQLIEQLLKPEAYLPDEEVNRVELITTQMSAIFLTREYAYKVKLPVDFGFLDYTTLEKRKHFCEEELKLNREISPEIYLGVVPITQENGGLKVNGEGNAVEYAVKMKQLPQENIMSNLLRKGKIGGAVVDELAKKVAEMHMQAETSAEISRYGSLETIMLNWEENFEQTAEFVGVAVDKGSYDAIKKYVYDFVGKNKNTFEQRIKEGRIKRCHGDLHSGNVFVIGNKVYLFDRIEFNMRFSCSDTAADVAFMAMDLDFFGRADFSGQFVNSYEKCSGDNGIKPLLNFYKCYRAYVRGKINCFRYREKHTGAEEKQKALDEAKKYFELAKGYTEKHI